jgi:hypothetical protein
MAFSSKGSDAFLPAAVGSVVLLLVLPSLVNYSIYVVSGLWLVMLAHGIVVAFALGSYSVMGKVFIVSAATVLGSFSLIRVQTDRKLIFAYIRG